MGVKALGQPPQGSGCGVVLRECLGDAQGVGFGWVCVEEVGSVGLNLGSFQILGCRVRRLCCEGE